jgi:hypothetical protein
VGLWTVQRALKKSQTRNYTRGSSPYEEENLDAVLLFASGDVTVVAQREKFGGRRGHERGVKLRQRTSGKLFWEDNSLKVGWHKTQ